MAYKILGQAVPTAAATEYNIYTVPVATSAIASTISVCNRSPFPATYRLAVVPAADGSTADKHWIVYGATVDGSDSTMLTLGITLAAGDKIQYYSSATTVSFSVFGSEIS